MIDPKGNDDYYGLDGKYLGNDGTQSTKIRLISADTWGETTNQPQDVNQSPNQFKESIAKQLQAVGREIIIENSSQKYQDMWSDSKANTANPVEQAGYIVLDVNNATLTVERVDVKSTSNEAEDPYAAGDAFKGNSQKIVIANIHTHPKDTKNDGKMGRNYKSEDLPINDANRFDNQYAPGGDGQTAKTRGGRYTIGDINVDYHSPKGKTKSVNNIFTRNAIESGKSDIKKHALENYGGKN